MDRGIRARCSYCHSPGHIKTNKEMCWKSRVLKPEDGYAHVYVSLLETMRSKLFDTPEEVRTAMRLVRESRTPQAVDCVDVVLYHQMKANEHMKATAALIGAIGERMMSLHKDYEHPPDELPRGPRCRKWEDAITERGDRVADMKRACLELEVHLDVVGSALQRGFAGEVGAFECLGRRASSGPYGLRKDGDRTRAPAQPVSTSLQYEDVSQDSRQAAGPSGRGLARAVENDARESDPPFLLRADPWNAQRRRHDGRSKSPTGSGSDR